MFHNVDQTKAMRTLHKSFRRCQDSPSVGCSIKPAIDFILAGKNCLTYRYILMTALVAKATEEGIDILSLQASDNSSGAYDARSLCSHVIYPFQRDFLSNVLDGSNEDPLVNNPGRNPRLSKDNKSANGAPRVALGLLCDNLPLIATSDEANACLDYLISQCIVYADAKRSQAESFSSSIMTSDVFSTRRFMNEMLDKSFGGTSLLVAATSVFRVLCPPDRGFKVVPHPVNQCGRSSHQMSDLDIFFGDGSPYLAIELKDKPFSEAEVSKAAATAFKCKAPSMLFVAGRASTMTDEIYRYFNDAKTEYEKKGMVIGVMSIDALLDYFFTTSYQADMPQLFDLMDKTINDIHAAPEVLSWVYRNIENI